MEDGANRWETLVDFDGSSLKLLEVELQGSDYRNVCFTGSGYILGGGKRKN